MISARVPKVLITSFILVASATAACRVHTSGNLLAGGEGEGQPPPPAGGDAYGGQSTSEPGTGAGVTAVETIQDESGKSYKVLQGERGEPTVIGCADGQREAFVDRASYPKIAGCLATWPGAMSLRAPRAGKPCGDDAVGCVSPGDACAPGWHVCASDGAVADLKQVTPDQCAHAGGGRFSAGMSHCTAQADCKYDTTPNASYPCFANGWCSEPVCCGDDCGDFGSCRDGVWPGATHIAQGTDQGCAASTSRRAGGILCCK
jgi:hypothetical protein